jgi:hypothetical protein
LRKIILKENEQSIPHNINKFARNMDIVITGEQSKMLNELWTNNLFSNQDKMFLFKLHNNTLGYNNAVAHFVAGHSPYCMFCDITREPEQNPETPMHLFFEWNSVNILIGNLFRKITGNNEFNVNRREFFGGPITVLFSDQNFPALLPCDSGMCINIVRLENAELLELFEIAKEIFGSTVLAEGSIFMFGSASCLSKSGTSLYAREWTEVVARSNNHWRGIQICPLVPVILSECPGSIVRELSELATWYDRMYDSNPQGLRETWSCLVKAMEDCSMGITALDAMDTYKLILPSSLHARTLDHTVTFCSNSSRPVIFKGLSKDNKSDLLGSLLTSIFENFFFL